jgi:hypothetical protein
MRSFLSLALAAVASLTLSLAAQAPDCRDAAACRQAAMDAAARKDYDQFHDLAWKVLNLSPRNDAEAMTLLARAQSLSGRPHDALVMLNRLAAMNVVTDAATSDDFRNVRDLPGWAELEAKLAGKPLPPAPPPTPASNTPVAAPAAPSATPATAPTAPDPGSKAPAKATSAARGKTKPAPAAVPAPGAEPPAADAPAKGTKPAKPEPKPPVPLAFSASALRTTVGLAYDAVSGRFIVGDGQDRRLMVLGERSGRLDGLTGIDAGFDEIAAFEIDGPEGDLWVVSGSPQSKTATVHKLQLISGRVLFSVPLAAEAGAGRFTDVAVTAQSVLVLDAEGRRVFRLAKKGKALDLALRLAAPAATSLAPAQEGVAYVAYDAGVLKLDFASRTTAVIEAGEGVNLSGLTWIRAIRGSLIGIQRIAGDGYQLVRIRLDDNGRTARKLEVIEGDFPVAAPSSASIVGNTLHYLSRLPGSDDVTVRKVTIK